MIKFWLTNQASVVALGKKALNPKTDALVVGSTTSAKRDFKGSLVAIEKAFDKVSVMEAQSREGTTVTAYAKVTLRVINMRDVERSVLLFECPMSEIFAKNEVEASKVGCLRRVKQAEIILEYVGLGVVCSVDVKGKKFYDQARGVVDLKKAFEARVELFQAGNRPVAALGIRQAPVEVATLLEKRICELEKTGTGTGMFVLARKRLVGKAAKIVADAAVKEARSAKGASKALDANSFALLAEEGDVAKAYVCGIADAPYSARGAMAVSSELRHVPTPTQSRGEKPLEASKETKDRNRRSAMRRLKLKAKKATAADAAFLVGSVAPSVLPKPVRKIFSSKFRVEAKKSRALGMLRKNRFFPLSADQASSVFDQSGAVPQSIVRSFFRNLSTRIDTGVSAPRKRTKRV